MLRITTRDVLWLMVVVGFVCAWRIEHRKATEDRAASAKRDAMHAVNEKDLQTRIAIYEAQAERWNKIAERYHKLFGDLRYFPPPEGSF